VRLCAHRHGALECGGGVANAKRHGAHRGSVCLRETLAKGLRLGVDDEIDVALRMQRHVLAAMPGDDWKAQSLEQAAQQCRVGCGVFDELESVGTHRICHRMSCHHWPLEGN
jgi:hypothetical protein